MAVRSLLLALLVYCVSEAQSRQGHNTSLPLSFNITQVQGNGTTCPNELLRRQIRSNITNTVQALLQDTVIPQLLGSSINQSCSRCQSAGRLVASLNMTDPVQQCPPEWQEITVSGVRTCARISSNSSSCNSVVYPSNGTRYNQVCGRIIGYQYCTADAFGFRPGDDIDSYYLDGVSVTHGSNPREHVWSFAVGYFESNTTPLGCPCLTTPNRANTVIPLFVGDDFFCDTGAATAPICSNITTDLIVAHPLWDGGGCGPTGGCCENNNPPWFCKMLPQPTTDDIEVRICADEQTSNEDTAIELIEIYVV